MSHHRIYTDGNTYRVATLVHTEKTFFGKYIWVYETSEVCPAQALGRTKDLELIEKYGFFKYELVPLSFNERRKAVCFVKKKYGETAVIQSPPWRQC